jgi:hypothetical protein
MIPTIKLMPDYGSWPLWWYKDTDRIGNIDPKTLNLSKWTIERLDAWARRYESYLDMDDPGNSPDQTPEEQQAFEQEGLALWDILQKELNDKYKVVYFSHLSHQILTSRS